MTLQFPVHISGSRAIISMLLKQGKKCNQNRRKLYSANSFPVMITGISCVVILPCNFPVRDCSVLYHWYRSAAFFRGKILTHWFLAHIMQWYIMQGLRKKCAVQTPVGTLVNPMGSNKARVKVHIFWEGHKLVFWGANVSETFFNMENNSVIITIWKWNVPGAQRCVLPVFFPVDLLLWQ